MSGRIGKDITDQKFGRLLATRKTDKKDNRGRFLWEFKCDCGKTVYNLASNVFSGKVSSCGCLKKDVAARTGSITGKRHNDLTNKRFGKLLVVKETDKRDSSGSIIWECKCDCGNTTYTSTSNLNTGTKSCGCLKSEIVSQKMSVDITNQRFGKLIAKYPTNKRSGEGILWYCECDCGSYKLASARSLRRLHTISCGCVKSKGEVLVREILSNNNISFIEQKTFKNCVNPNTGYKLRFDFYLPDYNCCIEYDGIQHFEKTFYSHDNLEDRHFRDKVKDEYCKVNHIQLIRINYKLPDKEIEQEILNGLKGGI